MIKFIQIQCIVLCIFSFSYKGFASNVIVNEVEVQHLNKALTNNTVTCIYQDEAGYIWIGTFDGLNRYDGINVRKYYYDPDDSTSITGNSIQKIAGDKNGNIWVGTNNGLSLYNLGDDNFIRYYHDVKNNKSLPSGSISDILFDSEKRLWVLGDYLSLYNYEANNFTRVKMPALADKQERIESYNRVFEDKQGRLWFLMYQQIFVLDKGEKLPQLFFDGVKQPIVKSLWYFMHLVQLDSNKFLVSTYNGGILEINYDQKSIESFQKFAGVRANEFNNKQLFQLIKDSKNRIWITPENEGIYVFDENYNLEMRLLNNRDDNSTIAFNSVWTVFEDNANRIWLGLWQSGVDIIDSYYRKFKHFYYKPAINSLSHNVVRDVIEDTEGNLYISTDGGGLNFYNRNTGKFTNYTSQTSNLTVDALLPLEFDSKGNLWIGTWNGGINVFDTKTKTFSNYQPSKVSFTIPHFFDIENDGKGNMYCASWGGGLNVYNVKSDTWKTYRQDANNSTSICSDFIFSLLIDTKQRLWIGTGNGLDMLNLSDEEAKFIHYKANEADSLSLSNNTINTIYEDLKGNIWVGTVVGLNKFLPEKNGFKRYGKKNGFVDENINSLIQNNNGEYWLGSNKGLIRFNAETMDNMAYAISDGMQGYEYSRNAAKKLSTGEFVFGGTKGFNLFDPSEIKENPNYPNVILTDFKINNKSVKVGTNEMLKQHISKTDKIVLNHHQNVFTIEYIALNFTHPEKNTYAYKLEGFDKDWVYKTNEYKVTYANLKSGIYTFKLKAANNDGLWNEKFTTLQIEVIPPWWETLYFRALAVVLIIALIIFLYKIFTKKLKRDKLILENKIKNATKDLESRNETLHMAQEKLENIVDEVKGRLGDSSYILLDASKNQLVTIEDLNKSIEKMVEDMNINSKQIADFSSKATEVNSNASKSVATIEEAVDYIKNISKEISIIFEIAQQTKILSLNAAVESARAGVHGKAFSVVAKEVQKLSERSQHVAQNIVNLSDSGLQLSNEANEKINELFGFIQNFASLTKNINEFNQEQSVKVNEINSSIQEILDFVKRTTHMANELDAAIKSLAVK